MNYPSTYQTSVPNQAQNFGPATVVVVTFGLQALGFNGWQCKRADGCSIKNQEYPVRKGTMRPIADRIADLAKNRVGKFDSVCRWV